MSLTMHSASVPVFIHLLNNMDTWLERAAAHAEAKKFDSAVYLASRLAPDMLPFTKQIQIACDTVKFCVARLAGIDSPKFEDDEKTLAELRERIGKTIAFAESVPADRIDGSEGREITVPRRDGTMTLTGEAYLQRFALPNFYFHATTTYALLRHNGVELGKMDFLGQVNR